MLKELGLKNFKALEDVSLSLGRITVLIGPNGTGKSSVLQAVALLKQSRGQRQIMTSGANIDLGTYEDIVHRHIKDSPIEVRLLVPVTPIEIVIPTVPVVEYQERFKEILYQAKFESSGLYSHSLDVRGLGVHITGTWDRVTGGSVKPGEIQVSVAGGVRLQPDREITLPIRIGGLGVAENRFASAMEQARAGFESVFTAVNSLLERTYVIPRARGFTRSVYPLQDEPTDDFFVVRNPDDQAALILTTIHIRLELQEAISDLSNKVLELRMRVRPMPRKQLAAEAYDGSQANLVNEGFGANQLMVLLAQLVVAPEDSLLGIEEPEIHLHPRAQAALADIFAELVTSERKQIVLTTHSEHVLMGLLTQVARGRLKPEDLRVYYFQKDEAGVASAEALEVDKRGRLKGGLKGFFEANLDELDSYLEALSRPRAR